MTTAPCVTGFAVRALTIRCASTDAIKAFSAGPFRWSRVPSAHVDEWHTTMGRDWFAQPVATMASCTPRTILFVQAGGCFFIEDALQGPSGEQSRGAVLAPGGRSDHGFRPRHCDWRDARMTFSIGESSCAVRVSTDGDRAATANGGRRRPFGSLFGRACPWCCGRRSTSPVARNSSTRCGGVRCCDAATCQGRR